MATRSLPEGGPRAGAGPFRPAGRPAKTALAAGTLIALLAIILTFDKTVFFFRLAGAALRPNGGGDELAVLADCAGRRPGLLAVLEAQSGNPGFLAPWLASALKRGGGTIDGPAAAPFVARAGAHFPDNPLLAELGFYGESPGPRDWGCFDPLFFRLAKDPGFNALSAPALERAFGTGRLETDTLPPLLSALDWLGNPALAGDLRAWAKAAGRFPDGMLSPRPATPPGAGLTDDPEAVLKALSGDLGTGTAGLGLGINLLAEAPGTGGYDENWEFLDMSSRAPFAKGSFAGGPDPGAGRSLRVMGFFVKTEPGKVPCRAGFGRRRAVALEPKTYLLQVFYRTLGRTERPSVWLAAPEYLPERELRPTAGAWRRALYVFKNAGLAMPEVKPLFRMWGRGTVWFTGFGLYELKTGGRELIPGKDALFDE